jgi:ankyrin repeat protein
MKRIWLMMIFSLGIWVLPSSAQNEGKPTNQAGLGRVPYVRLKLAEAREKGTKANKDYFEIYKLYSFAAEFAEDEETRRKSMEGTERVRKLLSPRDLRDAIKFDADKAGVSSGIKDFFNVRSLLKGEAERNAKSYVLFECGNRGFPHRGDRGGTPEKRMEEIASQACLKMADVDGTMVFSSPERLDSHGSFQGTIICSGTVTLNGSEADIREVLLKITRENGMNLVAEKAVRGNVSFLFLDLPVPSAIKALLRAGNFDFAVVNDVLVVSREGHFEKIQENQDGPFPQSTQKISLETRDLDILEILKIIASQANLIIQPDKFVRGNLTIRMNDVPVPIALKTIIGAAKYDFEVKNDVLAVGNLRESRERQERKLFKAVEKGSKAEVEAILAEGTSVDSKNRRGETSLIQAIKSKNPEMVAFLIEKGADVKISSPLWDGGSLLHYTVEKGNEEILSLLISKGLDINSEDDRSQTPLNLAVQREEKDMVELLLVKGADPNTWNDYWCTPFGEAERAENKEIITLFKARGLQPPKPRSIGEAAATGDIPLLEAFLKAGKSVDEKDKKGRSPLQAAAEKGAAGMVSFLLQKGADPNSRDGKNWTPLHRAALGGHKDIVEMLVSKGADIKEKNLDEGVTPFHCAVSSGKIDLAEFFLQQGASLQERDKDGCTLLHAAVAWNNVNMVQFLVERGLDVNASDRNEATPLHKAAQHGFQNIVEFLLKHGAAVNVKDKSGETPFQKASDRQLVAVMDVLLSQGGKADEQAGVSGETALRKAVFRGHLNVVEELIKKGADLFQTDIGGSTLLHEAVKGGKPEMVRFLLEKKLDVNAENALGETPIYEALMGGDRMEILSFLVAHGAKVDFLGEKGIGKTPLFKAIGNGSPEVVRFLIEKGADVNQKTGSYKKTALHIAAFFGRKEIVQLLIKKGARLNMKDDNGETPLFSNIRCGSLDILEELLKAGAKVDEANASYETPLHHVDSLEKATLLFKYGATIKKDENGWTPLHQAVLDGKKDLVDLFLAKGAQINEPTNSGKTPLHLASEIGKREIVEFLLEKNALVDVTDIQGQTPVQLAFEYGFKEIVALLQSRKSRNPGPK